MDSSEIRKTAKCDVCGGANPQHQAGAAIYQCHFCQFKKDLSPQGAPDADELIFAEDINQFFTNKYKRLNKGQTFELSVSVSRFYKTPKPKPGQINFFNSKNIMFLIEQHGFQFVSRKSRFSTELCLLIRKL